MACETGGCLRSAYYGYATYGCSFYGLIMPITSTVDYGDMGSVGLAYGNEGATDLSYEDQGTITIEYEK